MTLTFTAVQSNKGKTAAAILLNFVKHISNIMLKCSKKDPVNLNNA